MRERCLPPNYWGMLARSHRLVELQIPYTLLGSHRGLHCRLYLYPVFLSRRQLWLHPQKVLLLDQNASVSLSLLSCSESARPDLLF